MRNYRKPNVIVTATALALITLITVASLIYIIVRLA